MLILGAPGHQDTAISANTFAQDDANRYMNPLTLAHELKSGTQH